MLLTRRPDIDRFLAGPDKAVRAAIVHGRDNGVVRERAQAIARASTARPDDPFDVALLTESDVAADEGRLEGELTALSMLGGRRLVRLRLTGELASIERAAAEALARHLRDELNPDAFLLVEAPALRNDSALVKAGRDSAACAIIACYEDEPEELARMARAALAEEGLALNAEALEAFVARLPHDRGVARQEIERLVLYLGAQPRPVALGELAAFFGVEPDASLGDAAVHAFGGRMRAAQSELRLAFLEGEGGVAAVRALLTHLSRLRRIRIARDEGAAPQAAVKSAGVFWKLEREALRQSQCWTSVEIAAAGAEIQAAELACKQARAPDHLIAERLAFSIAERAARLGL